MSGPRERELLAANNAYLERARTAERRLKQVEEERDRATRRCDMYHGQCDRQAAELERLQKSAPIAAAWLVTSGPDGQCSRVAIGLENLKREVVAAIFGDAGDDSDEAMGMRCRLDTPSEWDGDRWSISWSFEDGYLNVQRVTDMPRLAGFITAPHPVNDAELIDGLDPAYGDALAAPGSLVTGEDAFERYQAAIPFGGDMVSNPQGEWVRFEDAMAKIGAALASSAATAVAQAAEKLEAVEYMCGQWEKNQGVSSLTIAVRSLLAALPCTLTGGDNV